MRGRREDGRDGWIGLRMGEWTDVNGRKYLTLEKCVAVAEDGGPGL